MTQHNPHRQSRWWILAALCVAQLMVILDATVVNIALPSAQRDLGFSNSNRQWIITSYALAFGSLLLLGGKLSDLAGRKRILTIGLCGFALASAVGGAAQSFLMLAAARAVQGAFGALMAPAILSLVSTTFTEPAARNKAFGIFGGVISSGASVGLLLGGALTQWIDWRAVMYVNDVIVVFALIGVLTLLVNGRPAEQPRLDLAGAAVVTAGLAVIVFGFSRAETAGWGDPQTIGSLAAGMVLLALFVILEARVPRPLLPLRILADRNRGASYLTIAFAAVGLFGLLLFLTYDLQGIRGYSPIRAGIAFLPMTLAVTAASIIGSTMLQPRLGPRWLVAIGMALGALGMLYLTRLDVRSTYAAGILPALLMQGLGLGLVFSSATNLATFGVEPRDSGEASATVNACQLIGGSLGTALLSTIAAEATTSYLKGLQPTAAAIARASVHGYTTAWAWSAAIFAAGAVVALVLYPLRRPATPAPQASETAPAFPAE